MRTLLLSLALLAACQPERRDIGEKPDEGQLIADPNADVDGDDVPAAIDCDDEDPTIYVGATELCDGIDQDCDGEVDEGATGGTLWYPDADADGYGDAVGSVRSCLAPPGHVASAEDCDDGDAATYPTAREACEDPVDRNCDGSVQYADADRDGWAACLECDDADAAVNPDAVEVCDDADTDEDCSGSADDDDAGVTGVTTWYRDFDADGYAAGTEAALVQCDAPAGYTAAVGDCAVYDALVSPGAAEVCDDADADEDCDGRVEDADASVDAATWQSFHADGDGDGYGAGAAIGLCDGPAGFVANDADCDDGDAAIHPAATEACDTADVDEDCDGLADDADTSPTGTETFYADTDGDGYGDAASPIARCSQPAGYQPDATDCDDSRAAVHPAGTEVCDAADLDEDCDGTADDADPSVTALLTWYRDADGDAYGVATATASACALPAGYAAASGDCDDGAAAIHPGATEVCDAAETDEDCDGAADDDDGGVTGGLTWYRDLDADGYGRSTSTRSACLKPTGYVALGTDCDDTTATVSPAATEVCDAADVDEDCDTLADDADGSATGQSTWHADADTDGYGAASVTRSLCERPSGYLADATDCNDGVATIYPGAPETCDDVDQDCDGAVDDGLTLYFPDYDADGYGDDLEDGVCTAFSPSVTVGGDCDELDFDVNPGADETCNSIDDDCDTYVDDDDASLAGPYWYTDDDGDGYGETATAVAACSAPGGTVADAGDCDDADADLSPAELEIYGDAVDEDCDGETEPVGTYCTPNVPSVYASISAALTATGSACLDEGTYTGSFSGEGTIAGQGPGRSIIVGTVSISTDDELTLESLSITGYVNGSAGRRLYMSDCAVRTSSAYGVYMDYTSLRFTMDGCEVSGATDTAVYLEANTTSGRGTYTPSASITNSWIHDSERGVYGMGQFFGATTGSRGSLALSVYNNTFSDIDGDVFYIYGAASGTVFIYYYNNIFSDVGNILDELGSTAVYDGSNSTDPTLDETYSPPRPVAGSTLIGGANTTYAQTTDFWGQARDSAPDIGAVEY